MGHPQLLSILGKMKKKLTPGVIIHQKVEMRPGLEASMKIYSMKV